MVCKAKDNYGFMPQSVSADYGISPVDGKENKKVWPPGENWFCIAKGEKYNVGKTHPFFGDEVPGDKKVQHDDSPSPGSRKGLRS